MSGVRLELANPNEYASPKRYVEEHLAPVVTELHRIVEELLQPGASSAEEWAMDMGTATGRPGYQLLSKRVYDDAKHVVFDGSEYFSVPEAVLREKRVKVLFTALVYHYNAGFEDEKVRFRLVDEDGTPIEGSELVTDSREPVTLSVALAIKRQKGCIQPTKATYYIEGCSSGGLSMPVCRRFSLGFLYI